MSKKAKVIDFKIKEELFPDKVSIEELRKIWDDKDRKYTDEELETIRNWLYAISEVIIRVTEKTKRNYKQIQSVNDYENKQSNPLCQGEHRRAS
jgi:hypothetical protein